MVFFLLSGEDFLPRIWPSDAQHTEQESLLALELDLERSRAGFP